MERLESAYGYQRELAIDGDFHRSLRMLIRNSILVHLIRLQLSLFLHPFWRLEIMNTNAFPVSVLRLSRRRFLVSVSESVLLVTSSIRSQNQSHERVTS
jgi:hypothetical protein